MTAPGIAELDVTRAVAVLNAAMKHRMFPEGAIPETDGDKIIEAEKIVVLAQQAQEVANAVGPANVPNYQAIMDVMFEAQVTLGIGSEPGPASPPAAAEGVGGPAAPGSSAESAAPSQPPPPQPSAEPSVGEFHVLSKPETNEVLYTHEGCDERSNVWMVPHDGMPDPKVGDTWECPGCTRVAPITIVESTEQAPTCGEGDPHRPGVFCEATKGHPPPHYGAGQTWDSFTAPAPSPPPEPQVAQVAETWLDENGGEWKIISGGGGPQIQVISVATGDETIVPAGFLKRRKEESSTTPSPPPPPSSSSVDSAGLSPVMTSPATASPSPSATGSEPSPAQQPSLPQPPSSSPSEPRVEGMAPYPPRSPLNTTGDPMPDVDTDGDEVYERLIASVNQIYMPEGMPVPMDLETPPEGIPDDLTAIGVAENRRLHSQFNALSARARLLRSVEAARARDCDRVRKRYLKEPMREARSELGKDASVTEVVQRAEEAETVEIWTARVQYHSDRADAYKTFFDMYSENVVVLSRDYTMREIEERGS